ncbi:MAG TPA: HEAT repeat domain-containing protein [Vicinamibacterales bacterium]|nr:HEAT repeat domain-containing protein [Vicinamibacterales bacterium]
MAGSAAHDVLDADAAARLVEFARSCRTAARAVSLYPGGHPAVGVSLSRLAEASARLTADGPFAIQVHADDLLVQGARIPKADAAVPELASLLHRHLIGGLTLNAGANADSWRTLLLLLARTPDAVRADGGIAHLWATAGGPSLEVRQIDYSEVLREKQGQAATIDAVIAAALAGRRLNLADDTMQAIVEIVADPRGLQGLLAQLARTASSSPGGVEVQAAGLLNVIRGLIEYVSGAAPLQLDTILEQLAQGIRHLSADGMIALLAVRSRPEAMAAEVDVVSALVERMSDASVAGFVAGAVVAERGASERLAHAFRSLVPELDRQRQLLALARDEAAASEIGRDEDGFPGLWQRVEQMMTSYSDSRYVSEDYARELSHARTQPVDVERTSDDPPERIAAWLATVSDGALRSLDRDLLTDLLHIEEEPQRWRDLAGTVVAHADDLLRVGYFDLAWTLVEQVIEQGQLDTARQPHAARALERFARGSLMKHVSAHLRNADETGYARFTRLCHAIGPPVIAPLAEVLASEQDARSRHRLRDVLVGFGPRGADAVRPLMQSATWEVRRTAAYLLRELGGTEGLRELVSLLTDHEPLVQREAVQGLILNGSAEASAILTQAVLAATGRARDTLLNEVLGLRDDRAAPLFSHVLRSLEPDRLPRLYMTAIEVLGSCRTVESIEALRTALHKGRWWTPLSNRRMRAAAALSLRRIGTPPALDALRDATVRGAFGVRAAARAGLEGLEQP